MSYILEALKKAQAERQLGGTPTLDALPVHPPLIAGSRRALTPATFGVLVVAVIALAAALTMQWWRPSAPTPTAAAPVSVPAPAPVAVAAPAVVASTPPLVVAPPSAPAKEIVKPAPVPAAPEKPAPPPVVARPAEESLPTLRELPENVRAAIPQLSFGGYMYSNNPSDRLILVDKVLRHEGEEVAPGLVLEKLLPKAAQMNYRGTRYLVPI
jgi:general secretion pathway protein B